MGTAAGADELAWLALVEGRFRADSIPRARVFTGEGPS